MSQDTTKTVNREAYTYREAKNVAEAAILITQEANDAGCPVVRPFTEIPLEGRPDWTAAHAVMCRLGQT